MNSVPSGAAIFHANNRLMFGQVREDAAVDMFLVEQIQSRERLFVIASGGCTAFSLLAGRSMQVDALDISRAQIALVELKLVLFRKLGLEAARAACRTDATMVYQSVQVRSQLSPDSITILDAYAKHFDHGLNNCGWVDRRMSKLRFLFFLFIHSFDRTKRFLSLSNVQEQTDFYLSPWSNWQWRLALQVAFSKTFLALVHGKSAERLVPSDFSNVMEKRVRRALTEFPNLRNPYLWQAFFGQYNDDEESMPPYLQTSNFEKILANLPNLNLICDDTLNWFRRQPAASFDYIGLSNIIELLPPDYALALQSEIVRCAKANALICVRAIFPRRSRVFSSTQTNEAGSRLQLDAELSTRAAKMDRSLFCNFYEIYRRLPD